MRKTVWDGIEGMTDEDLCYRGSHFSSVLERFPERLNRWGDSHSHTNRIQDSCWEKGPDMDGKTVLERSSRTRRCDN
jgi:hypothetical protein